MTHRVNLIAGKRSAADATVRHFEPYSPHRFALARRAARWVWLPLVLTVAMGAQARAVAPEVKDGGSFFTPETITKANAQLAEIEKKYKKDFLIETFATVPTDKAEAVNGMDKDARKRFFQEWAKERAKAVGVNGIYVLISKQPGHVQLEVGDHTGKHDFRDPEDRDELDKILLTAFRNKKYDQGLLAGIQFVDEKLGEHLGKTAHAVTESLPQVIRQGANKIGPAAQGASGMSWILIIIVVLIGFWILRAIFRGITGGARRYGPGPGPGYGGPGYGGGAGYGGPGYGGGGGGGGGFMSGMLGGLFGAAAGNWLYDSFGRGGGGFGGGMGGGGGYDRSSGGGSSAPAASDADQDYSGTGGDFGDSGSDGGGGGGDFGDDSGGGGDFGGDSGGGGGDFGGGGGDFGGGGGDFGGGGGDF